MPAAKSEFCQSSATTLTLKGGVLPDENVNGNLPWSTLTDRLSQISLVPHDVGGSGDCFFKSVSHQLYGTAQLHYEIRMSGIAHLNNHPELYIESISNNNWANYVKQMSNQGTWCDNIIIQAVANANNCVIHITESDINKPQGTIITPIFHDQRYRVIFIGYINYVSTLPDKSNPNRTRLAYLKKKLSQDRHKRLQKLKDYNAKRRTLEADENRHNRLEKLNIDNGKRRATETDEDRQKRLKKRRDSYAKRRAEETIDEKQERLKKKNLYQMKSSNRKILISFISQINFQ